MSRGHLIATFVAVLVFFGVSAPATAQKVEAPESPELLLEQILEMKANGPLDPQQDRVLQGLYRHYVNLTANNRGERPYNPKRPIPGREQPDRGGSIAAEDCASISVVNTDSFSDSSDTTGAVDDLGQVNSCVAGTPFTGTGVAPDLMYEFAAPEDGTLTASATDTAGDDLNVRILDDSLVAGDPCSDGDGSCLSIADNFFGGATEVAQADVSGGTNYVVVVDGYYGSAGPFDLDVEFAPLPPNDDCVDALPISCDTPIIGSSAGTTADGVTVCGSSGEGASTVWFNFVSPGDGPVTVNTCGDATTFDTQLDVFTGSCGALSCVDGNDDSCGLQSEVTFNAVTGEEYQFMVHGFGAASGDFELAVDCTDPGFQFFQSTVEIPTASDYGLAIMIAMLMALGLGTLLYRRL